MLIHKLSALVLASSFLLACGAEAPPPNTPQAPAAGVEDHTPRPGAGPVVAPGEAKVGDTTKCPVSGEEFVVEATSPSVVVGDKTYFLCCSGCKKKFEADPQKYLNKT